MRIEKSHHVDEVRDADGGIEASYEYDLFRFSEGSLVLVARAYAHEPRHVAFLRMEDDSHVRLLQESDSERSLVQRAFEYLRAQSYTRIEWLSESGYRVWAGDG